MNGVARSHQWNCKLQTALLAGFLVIENVVLGSVGRTQDLPANSAPATLQVDLEGLKFVGPFGAEGVRNRKQDTFIFKGGKFWAANCLEWGFTPAPFWTRRDAKGIHFLAELKSPEHGTMRYKGLFDGKKLAVVAHWRKERWYWTVERIYRGEGRLASVASR